MGMYLKLGDPDPAEVAVQVNWSHRIEGQPTPPARRRLELSKRLHYEAIWERKKMSTVRLYILWLFFKTISTLLP